MRPNQLPTGRGQGPAYHPCLYDALSAQPGWAGTIHDRAERRRPNDRRQQDRPVYLELRCNRGERRQQHRRAVYDPGRRRNPEPPLGIDIWV